MSTTIATIATVCYSGNGSDNVGLAAALSAAGYPALTAGKILVGRQHLNELIAAPRVVFVPVASPMAPRNARDPSGVNDGGATDRAINAQRSLMSEWLTIEVEVWAAETPRAADSGDRDYDVCRTLYQQVQRFLIKTLGPASFGGDKGILRFSSVEWKDDDATMTKLGRKAVFAFAVSTPVLDDLLPYAPSDAVREMTLEYSDQVNPPDPPIVIDA